MTKQTHVSLLAVLSLLLLSFATPVFAAAPVAGDLVKLANDGNPETTVDSAVYYVGSANSRYAFTGSKPYFTWYPDFSTVKIVTPAELAALGLVGNITYRPGTRLVKVTTDPKVYAVEPGGVLRPIASEEIAEALYGPTWNQQIDDLPDEYFFNYVIGAPLDVARFPDGSVVRRASDQALFLIDAGQKRRITTVAAKTALRVREAFIHLTSDNLGGYADGMDLTGAETYADTAQQAYRVSATPTFSFLPNASATFPIPGDAVLATLRVTTGSPLTLTKLMLKVSALKNEPIDYGVKGFDDDAGGLVRGLNAQLNIRDIRLVDETGSTVMGVQNLELDYALDQEQIVVFTGRVAIPAGGAVWQVRIHADKDMPLAEPYGLTMAHAFTELLDAAGAPVAFLPSGDLVSPKVSSARGTLEVKASASPASATAIKGAKDVAISGHVFQAPSSTGVVLRSITYTGLIDEREPGGTVSYGVGVDTDNGTSTFLNEIVPEVWLADNKGTRLAGPSAVDADGTVDFKDLFFTISAGTSLTLVVRGDIEIDSQLETVSNRLLFDIRDATKDVEATDTADVPLEAIGEWPLGGTSPKSFLTVAETGTLDLNWIGTSGDVVGGRETLLGRLDMTAKDDDFTFQVLSLKNSGSNAEALGDLRVDYLTKEGSKASVAGVVLGDLVTFTGLEAYAGKGKTSAVSLYGKPYSREAGVVSGSKIALSLQTAGPLQFTAVSSGKTYDESALGGLVKVGTNTATSRIVRWTSIAVQKADGLVPSSAYADAEVPTLGFVITAGAEGGVHVSKLTFRLTPSDRGLSKTVDGVVVKSDNDALERWADLDGDFADDDRVVTLFQVNGTTKTRLGEGADGSIRYSIGTDETPEGRDSTGNDYGRVVITFPDLGGISIGAGGEATFLLAVATDQLDDAKDHTLSTQLMGGADFGWFDSYFKGETMLPGDEDYGLPISGSVTVRH